MPEKDVTISTSESELVPYERSRNVLMITNTHTSAILKVTSERGKSSVGFRVYPQSLVILQKVDGDKPQLQYFAVSDTASTIVNIHEEFE